MLECVFVNKGTEMDKIVVSAYEGKDELIARKYFPTMLQALAWMYDMGIAGVHYTVESVE